MNISEIVQSHGWRNFMAKLYGWGASVVIIGALFKINHWPGGTYIIAIGLIVEAVIFFFSAFEPIHEEVDWTLVYPELAGMTDEEELQRYRRGPARPAGVAESAGGGGGGGGSAALAKFDEMLEKGDISQELFNTLGEGLKNLSNTAQNMKDISGASLATNEYVDKVKSASKVFEEFSSTQSKSSEDLNNSLSNLVGSYQKLSSSIHEDVDNISANNNNYKEKLEQLNNNLDALNAAYEMQLKGSSQNMENTKELYDGIGEMMNDLKASIQETKNYKEEISKLHKNLSELNNIYGNMLSSMSVLSSSRN